ncbi:hypothetical protein V1227_11595 [Lentzea sp. DG1S-22]|uniref:phenylacetate--CoA ligase family protein n=1 Tax=Lentzea sp. DG1S-22 TaxID=3108822 RepID=UPI002E76BC94|nr:hypothetical protein [Lentzea sp. DG1S-22]WVH83361.1 hypothetical protein V1227_11595 [Lentzea sp. DG1S-22]
MKLREILVAASRAELYAESVPALLANDVIGTRPLGDVLGELPLLSKSDLSARSHAAFTVPLSDFLHYYETSGTTGPASAAPKADDDLIVNTLNIGEMWARLLSPDDIALILIIGPLAPAPYQFEKVFEYLGITSLRPSVDYIDGDYSTVLRLIGELSVNVFVGAPSRLLAMIQFAVRQGLPVPRFDRLLLIAEQTGPASLRHLSHLTGAQAMVGSFGSSETGTTGVVCERGQLHLQSQSYVFELLDEQGVRLVDGSADSGELVVTTLDLLSRPLLRYRTGDLIEIDGRPCTCGLALPVMRTSGRQSDVLAFSSGAVHQEDLESVLWADGLSDTTILNYMLVIHEDEIVCLVTTDVLPDSGWADRTARRIAHLFPCHHLTVRPVEVLSPLTTLSGDLGWKLSRVLDLGDTGAWSRLPASMSHVVKETLESRGVLKCPR